MSKGLLFGVLIQSAILRRLTPVFYSLALIPIVCLFAVSAGTNLWRYKNFVQDTHSPEGRLYQREWGLQLFNDPNAFVVVAQQSRGRDYFHLYLTKHEGHVWCAYNKEFAPRAFWKSEGVQYVAWQTGVDPSTDIPLYEVRTIEQELALARANGWSSDINDVWSAHTMTEWANLSSRTFQDPCTPGQFDPRKW